MANLHYVANSRRKKENCLPQVDAYFAVVLMSSWVCRARPKPTYAILCEQRTLQLESLRCLAALWASRTKRRTVESFDQLLSPHR
ncbi:hypothetical protein PC119_g17635 [Phytophthora cactorum]|uniref:Uncharacterized protein n=1 Tax=Phytophthora cactorum TaxID=29920 RepID=A0A8T0YJP8_9STRA|nr:hypothetical protein PC113_g16817 [Phytophthora cactorum]KAG2997653.1 hypothetical protein PC119_g17635 [Phytophthora cactorum]KAG3069541.1 hypothetical protein PC122_g16528 [Phytophthora cactorum]